MSRFDSNGTEVLATNVWFGSQGAKQLTEGTVALEKLYSRQRPVSRHYVDCDAQSTTLHDILHFELHRNELVSIRSHLVRHQPQRVILLGGGCAVTLAVIPYLGSLYSGLRIVWVDAHGDLNLPATSKTKYIHGMALGALLNAPTYNLFFTDDWHLTPDRVALYGQKSLEPYERQFIAEYKIVSLSSDDWAHPATREFFGESRDNPVYVHIDLDVFHPDSYLNPKCQIAEGIDSVGLVQAISALSRSSQIVGYSIAENFETDATRASKVVEIFQSHVF